MKWIKYEGDPDPIWAWMKECANGEPIGIADSWDGYGFNGLENAAAYSGDWIVHLGGARFAGVCGSSAALLLEHGFPTGLRPTPPEP